MPDTRRRVYLKNDDFKAPKPDTPRVNESREKPTRDFVNDMAVMERELAEYREDVAIDIKALQDEVDEAQRELAEALQLADDRAKEACQLRERLDEQCTYAVELAGLLRRALDDLYALGDVGYATERDINAALAKQVTEEGDSRK